MRGFYVGVLGMVEVTKPERLRARGGAWFRAGAAELHVGIEDGFVPARKAHPGIAVTDVDALARAVGRPAPGGLGRRDPGLRASTRMTRWATGSIPAGRDRVTARVGRRRCSVRRGGGAGLAPCLGAGVGAGVGWGSRAARASGAAASRARTARSARARSSDFSCSMRSAMAESDDVATGGGEAHEHAAAVARVRTSLDEPRAHEAVDAVGHGARGDERLLHELAGGELVGRARRRRRAPTARRTPSPRVVHEKAEPRARSRRRAGARPARASGGDTSRSGRSRRQAATMASTSSAGGRGRGHVATVVAVKSLDIE